MPRTNFHRVIIVVFFICMANAVCPVFGQQLVYKFKQFTTNEGLPSSEVHQVLSDSRNFLWFATDHGVCRYDGYKFETFNLPDNSILSMYEDSKKRIWFVSFSGQLFYYENEKITSYKFNDAIIKNIEQVAINRVYIDSIENVYISTTAPNCFLIDAKGQVKRLFYPNKISIYKSFETENGNFFSYISGTLMSAGKYFFSVNKNITSIIIRTNEKKYQFQLPTFVGSRKNGVKKLSDGSLVFYAGEFLLRIFPSGKYTFKRFGNFILDVGELNNDKILVATIQEGLFILNKKNEVVDNYFQKLTVTSVSKDYEGGLWVSTTQAGVFYLNSLELKHFSENKQIINQKILCLDIVADSSIWAGGESGSIFKFHPDKSINNYSFPVISVNGIYTEIINKAILICSGDFIKKDVRTLLFYKKNSLKFILIQGLSDLIKFRGNIYNGNANGLKKINFKNKTTEFENEKAFRVSSLYLDSSRGILIGNLFGLWKYVNGDLQPYDSTKKILNSRITDINGFRNHDLLLGTRGKGLLFVSRNNLYQITSKNGMASDNIRKIFVDENIIWLATNRGLSKMTILSLNPFEYEIRNISVQDGLLSNEVNDIKRLDSNIVVATNGGISLFSRDLFSRKKQLPLSLYFTGIKINGSDTTINDNYSFSYKYNNLSLSFVALSYRESSNIEYRYRISGLDSNWVELSGREIQLNPIPYGRYSVEIQARRQNENWSDQNDLSINISRSLPFWRTIWFQVSSFLVAALIMLLFFIVRTRKIKQRERERTFLNKKLAEMELKALRAQMNPHFIFNVLNSIQYYITHNKNEEAQHYMSKFAKLVRSTLDNSRSTFITLSDELSLLRIYIDLEKIRFDDRFDYQIRIGDGINVNDIKIPNMLLQPYVENSIKHGFKNKEVKYFIDISISKEEGNIICIINDNGIGRGKASLISNAEMDKHSSAGTIIIKEKIEALKHYYNYKLSSVTEDIKDSQNDPAGTRVILTFPEKADISAIK